MCRLGFSLFFGVCLDLIIFSSRYSITVSKLIGYNPVAVLATLLLMSYNKILKVIIVFFSSVTLDYPREEKVTVWLKDGNLSFLHSRHLYLSIFTLFVLSSLSPAWLFPLSLASYEVLQLVVDQDQATAGLPLCSIKS